MGRHAPSDPAETRFADIAPRFDRFPGFAAADFDAFRKDKQRDSRRNGERLVVKRKLAALGEAVAPRLEAAGLSLTMRTSLSHPFKHNGFRVASQWVYWGRSDKEKRALKRKLGADLGADVDPTYQGVTLLVEVDERRVQVGMKIHPNAWWDGQNLKKRILGREEEARTFCALLNDLPRGFAMSIGGWKRLYEAGALRAADIQRFFHYYKPGEVWLQIVHETPRQDTIALGADLSAPLTEHLVALRAIFTYARWSPANDAILS
jgi:hypothetical protein